MTSTRRNFIAGAGALAAAPALPAATTAEHHWGDVRLAVATYSLRKFSRSQAISIVKDLGIKYVNVKSYHMPYYLSKEDLTAARKEFGKAGLTIVSGGNIGLGKDDEDFVRYHLEYAKNAGIPTVVCAPTHNNLGLIEKYAKKFDLKIAIHNHGPEDDHYPNGASVIKRVKNMDPRMGLCLDLGHAARTGVDVIEEIDRFKHERTERGHNAREVSRRLDAMRNGTGLSKGIALDDDIVLRVYWDEVLSKHGGDADLNILRAANKIQNDNPDRPVVIISKDINLRLRADAMGLRAEDYESDRVVPAELYSDTRELTRSEERRVGKECRSRWSPYH